MTRRRLPPHIPRREGALYLSRFCDACGRRLRRYKDNRDGWWCPCGVEYYRLPYLEIGGHLVEVKKCT